MNHDHIIHYMLHPVIVNNIDHSKLSSIKQNLMYSQLASKKPVKQRNAFMDDSQANVLLQT